MLTQIHETVALMRELWRAFVGNVRVRRHERACLRADRRFLSFFE